MGIKWERRWKWRDYVLQITTGFVFANARCIVQYHHYAWAEGIPMLLAYWLIHYVAIYFCIAAVLAVLHFFFRNLDEIDLDLLIRIVFSTVLVISMWVIFTYHSRNLPPPDEYEDFIATLRFI
jgi:hypothetical protein